MLATVMKLEPPKSSDDIPPEITIYEAMECLQHFECQQNPEELQKVCDLIRGKHSLLEIGSNFGGSLRRMGEVLAPNSWIVSLDLPEARHKLVDPIHSLKYNCQLLANMGHKVEIVMGDSHATMSRSLVRKHAPFDFIFIDGDHSYEGVKQDWLDYGQMGKIVGFHDIGGGTEGCVKFWDELRTEGKYRMLEFDHPRQLRLMGDWLKLGIGIVFRED